VSVDQESEFGRLVLYQKSSLRMKGVASTVMFEVYSQPLGLGVDKPIIGSFGGSRIFFRLIDMRNRVPMDGVFC